MHKIFKTLPTEFWAHEECAYKIRVLPARKMGRDLGRCVKQKFKHKPTLRELHISDACPPHLVWRTIIHEMVHAFDFENLGHKLSERDVLFYEEAIYRIAVVNGWIPQSSIK